MTESHRIVPGEVPGDDWSLAPLSERTTLTEEV